MLIKENQDGGIGGHTAPPRTTRTENRTVRGTDTKEIENKHSSRPVAGVERTRVAVAGQRLAEYGTNGAGSPTTSRPCGPTFAHR